MSTSAAFFSALLFAALAAVAVKTGQIRLKRPLRFKRVNYPVAFWLVVILYSLIAVFCLWMGIEGLRK